MADQPPRRRVIPRTLAPPLSPLQRCLFGLILAVMWILQHLPDRPIYRITYVLGAGVYLLMPRRRDIARRNLQRVCDWLVANEMATPRVARAAQDRTALERLVRATFGHWMLTYAEAVMAPRYGRDELRRRVMLSDSEATSEAMAAAPPGQPGPVHLAIHFGALDLSALYGVRVGALPMTGPMETVESPLARAYFERVRDQLGATIVPIGDAATELVAALKRGEAVGVVADRNIVGRGTIVELFGAPARIPTGPAVLSVQTGAALFLGVIERAEPGAWIGHTVRLQAAPGSRREAARSILELEVRAMERLIARAPEQWTTLFFPIWEDESDA